ncbi:MAG TPA: hypothetical protein VIM65_04305 [Cyclobacteriaceae bacterium]
MLIKNRFYILLTLAVLISACKSDKHKNHASTRAFYFWQTSIDSFHWNDSLYQSMKINKLYLRFFDVDWSNEAKTTIPVSPLQLEYYYNAIPDTVNVVPVVFITNETFKNLTKNQSAELAKQVHRKIMNILTRFLSNEYESFYSKDWWEQDPYNMKSKNFDELQRHDSLYSARMKRIHEIQFDCDWTTTTKDKYFAFLEEVKKLFPEQLITSTVRLYQYKYPDKAGVPPVSRGMLMCYNAGEIKDNKTSNSIFDKKEIMSYLDAKTYPLPLDYALPVFEWAVLFQGGKFKTILSADIIRDEYQYYLQTENENKLIVKEDFVYGNTSTSILIRKGDEIRLEQPDMRAVQEVTSWLSENKNNKEAIVSLYHLNNHDLNQHSKEIENIFNSF